MDSLRGLAVLLVILQHTTGIPRTYGEIDVAGFVEYSTGFLAPYRMPLLLVLSGMLLVRSVSKPLSTYYGGKVRKVAWPYLVWGVIVALASFSPESLLTIEYWRGGPSHLWFLAVLMACYLVGPAVRWIPPWIIPIAMVTVLVVVDPSTNFYRRILFFGTFFFIGAALFRHLSWLQTRKRWFPLVTGGFALIVAVSSMLGHLWVNHDQPWSILLSLPGVLLALWVMPRIPRMPWLEFAGRRSIALYCVHAPVMITVTLLAGDLAATAPALFYVIVVVSGFGIPVLAAVSYDRVKMLFEFPSFGGHHTLSMPSG